MFKSAVWLTEEIKLEKRFMISLYLLENLKSVSLIFFSLLLKY